MRTFLPLLLLTLASMAPATRAAAQQPSYCTFTGPLFFQAEQNPHFNGSLEDYFKKELAGHFPPANCVVTLQLWIDTAGKACCLKIDPSPNDIPGIDTTRILNSIAKMPAWTPGLQNHRPINFSALIKLASVHSKLTVTYTNEAPVYPPGFKRRRHR